MQIQELVTTLVRQPLHLRLSGKTSGNLGATS